MCSIEAHGYIVAGTDYNNFEEPNFKEGPPSDYKYANKPHKNIHRTQKDDVDEQDFNDTSLTRENHAPLPSNQQTLVQGPHKPRRCRRTRFQRQVPSPRQSHATWTDETEEKPGTVHKLCPSATIVRLRRSVRAFRPTIRRWRALPRNKWAEEYQQDEEEE